MKQDMNYGRRKVRVRIPNDLVEVTTVKPRESSRSTVDQQRELVLKALEDPTGSPRLASIIKPGDKVCIITSDITRLMPTRLVLPLVLDRLHKLGLSKRDISIVFALGMHRPHRRSEKIQLVGEDIFSRYDCVDSDPDDVEYVGDTEPAGTPVHVFRPVLQADRIICLGNVEYHYFAGYSGGLKAVLPGVCGRETVHRNHRMMFRAGSQRGRLSGNPVREDIDSVADLLDVDFIVNVIVDEIKNIEAAVAGHPVEAHRQAADVLDSTRRINVSAPGDLIVADAGGYPKDLNLYQAQKALDSASSFAADGAPIVFLAECAEGYGNEIFEKWLKRSTGREVRRRISRHFELGGHKAAALIDLADRYPVWLVSELAPSETGYCHMRKVSLPPDDQTLHLPGEVVKQMYRSSAEANQRGKPKAMVIPNAGSLCADVG